jgi:AhpD family alkylhydroperoxidase
MDARIDYSKASPAALKAMYALQVAVNTSGLEPSLQELVKLRVSQINGCAFCIDMHFREAKAKGEKEERLYLLDAWRESPVYTDRERAALAWAEAVTLVSQTHVPDEVFAEARKHFDESELVNLTLAVVAINGWNRFSISFRVMPLLGKAHG